MVLFRSLWDQLISSLIYVYVHSVFDFDAVSFMCISAEIFDR